jgi:quaternary ammonium compound-resistance protein SugE
MSWIYLLIAGIFEIVLAVSLKYTEGFTRLLPSIVTIASVFASMFFLALAVNNIPVGTAYAIWTGIGVVGVAVVGIWLFNEPATPARIFSVTLILAGIVGLKLMTE